MSRTQIVLDSKNNQQSSKVIEEILDSHGFDKTSKKGEDYWQQGIELLNLQNIFDIILMGIRLFLKVG